MRVVGRLLLPVFLVACSFLVGMGNARVVAEVCLVADGRATAVIVVPQDARPEELAAASDLQWHVRRASGVSLPVVREEELAEGSAEWRVFVGRTRRAQRLGLTSRPLLAEQFQIKTAGKDLLLLGDSAWDDGRPWRPLRREARPSLFFAVSYLLDRYLGVRWLWPGELGTFVPRRSTVKLPEINVTLRPPLEKRRLRVSWLTRAARTPGIKPLLDDAARQKVLRETDLWCAHHWLGTRTQYQFGHSFGKWWERFHRSHPDYFAKPPAGFQQPYPKPDRVKLCVSNPAVADQIVADWVAAGKPDNWNVCPNDGRGFCVCPNCRELDGVPAESELAIWNENTAVLTGRYVALWNKLIRRMRRLNPNVTLSSYAYSAYRQPLPDMKLEDGIVLGYVDVRYSLEEWNAWRAAGAKLFLRPNWWHRGGGAPYLPLHAQGEFFRSTMQNGMLGFDLDSLLGYWATQGPLYYLIARLSVRPDLTVDDVLVEYCSAFGAAAPAIRRYLQFWEQYTAKVGGRNSSSGQPKGLFARVCAEHRIRPTSSVSRFLVLPYLYPDSLLDQAAAILDQAQSLAQGDDEATARVRFLRDGLEHLRLTSHVVATAYDGQRRRKPAPPSLAPLLDELQARRAKLSPRHVVWGELVNAYEAKYRLATVSGLR